MTIKLSTGLILDLKKLIAIKPISDGSTLIFDYNIQIDVPLNSQEVYKEICNEIRKTV